MMLNLDVAFLTQAIGCIHFVKPATFGNVYRHFGMSIETLETFQIYEEVGSTVYILLESHVWLKSIRRWGIEFPSSKWLVFWLCSSVMGAYHYSWTLATWLRFLCTSFLAQLGQWAFCFLLFFHFFSGFTAWGVPLCISHLRCSGAWKHSSH